jgi:hypothetical protein
MRGLTLARSRRRNFVTPTILSILAAFAFVAATAAAGVTDGVDLRLSRSSGGGNAPITLQWAGGRAPYVIYRSTVPTGLTGSVNRFGSTTGQSLDAVPQASPIEFYEVVPLGCVSSADCGTGFCEDSVCCDGTCNGSCQACNVQGEEGLCSPLTGGPAAVPGVTAPTGQPIVPLPQGYAAGILVQPGETATLSAGGLSGHPPYTFLWRLISAPAASTAALSGAPGSSPQDISSQQNPALYSPLSGDYVAGLTVLDFEGCQSAEAQTLVRVRSRYHLTLQLTWDQPVDLDLQFAQGAAAGFEDSTACYWGRTTTSWGARLTNDDLAGCYPEEIDLGTIGGSEPPNGSTFSIFAAYSCDHRGHRTDSEVNPVCYEPSTGTSANATVTIYVDGVAYATLSRTLNLGDAWKAATLSFNGGIWMAIPTSQVFHPSDVGCDGTAACVCGQLPDSTDPYCSASGAGCRERYP